MEEDGLRARGPPGLHKHLFLSIEQPGQGLCGLAISRILPSSEECWDLNSPLYNTETDLLGLFRGSFQDTGQCWVQTEFITAAW